MSSSAGSPVDTPAPSPNILCLKGITLKDYKPIEDVFDEKVLGEVGGEGGGADQSPLPLDKIPETFTSMEDWPMSTDLRCWSCTFTFAGPPRFVPTSIRGERCESGERTVIATKGNFCTFNCAARYIDDYPGQISPEKRWRMRDQLLLAYYFFHGLRVQHIEPAPKKTRLTSYGGDLTEDEFLALMREIDPQNIARDRRAEPAAPERLRVPTGTTAWDLCAARAPAASSVCRSEGVSAAVSATVSAAVSATEDAAEDVAVSAAVSAAENAAVSGAVSAAEGATEGATASAAESASIGLDKLLTELYDL